jgi:hypothetical protein
MSVRFQFAGDKDISVGRAGGASLFKLPGAISFPAAGTTLSTETGVEYPIAQGGSSVNVEGTEYPSQRCDVYVKADGSGGSYYDWANAFNVVYKPYGGLITNSSGDFTVTINSTSYDVGDYTNYWYHDGSGSYYTDFNSTYLNNGETITSVTGITSYINIAGTDYVNGSYDEVYRSDGAGGYYSTIENASYTSNGTGIVTISNQTEVPSLSSNYFYNGTDTEYTHDGSGGSASNIVGAYYSYGDFITNYSGTDYYWDGSGSYYS